MCKIGELPRQASFAELPPAMARTAGPLSLPTTRPRIAWNALIAGDACRPFTHGANSPDRTIVLAIGIWMMKDNEEETLLPRARDAMIPCGNGHARSNRGADPCMIAFDQVDVVARHSGPAGEGEGVPRRENRQALERPAAG